MSYKVIHFFTDLQDFNHPYNVGDEFPHKGMTVSEARLNELSTSNNKQGKPLIALATPKVEVEEVKPSKYSKSEIKRMSTADLREVAKANGYENADEMTGADLKVELIKHFNL